MEKSCPSPLASGVGRRGIFLPRSVVIIIVSQEWGGEEGGLHVAVQRLVE